MLNLTVPCHVLQFANRQPIVGRTCRYGVIGITSQMCSFGKCYKGRCRTIMPFPWRAAILFRVLSFDIMLSKQSHVLYNCDHLRQGIMVDYTFNGYVPWNRFEIIIFCWNENSICRIGNNCVHPLLAVYTHFSMVQISQYLYVSVKPGTIWELRKTKPI